MAKQTSRVFISLLVISFALIILLASWGNVLENTSWAAFSGGHGGEGSWFGFKLWDENESSTPGSALNATQKAKKADSTKTNPATRPKTGQMGASTHGAVAETPMPVLSKSSFTKLPRWDFDDVYNQDAPPRQTKCAQSLRNSEDESFKKAFFPNMRLFLHKDNFNISEWNRLSHFNNPFGFMGFKYDEVMPSVKLIPKPKEPLLSPKPNGDGCVRCAVVGTAGILNGSKMGKEIDAHDYVFRMNGAVLKGYEEDVGNRTSVYVHTAHAITSSVYILKKYGYKSIPNDEGIKHVLIPEGMRDFSWLEGLLTGERIPTGKPYQNHRPRTYYGGQFNESRFYVLHQDFLRYVRNRFLMSRNLNFSHWAIVRPTNGAFTLFLALHTCDIVDAYGFMTEDYNKYSNYYVQKDVKTHVIFYANHDYILEKDLWAKLHKSKILKLYQRTDSDAETAKPNKRR